MEEIIILFFQVAWYAIWCVGLYTTVRWVGTRKVGNSRNGCAGRRRSSCLPAVPIGLLSDWLALGRFEVVAFEIGDRQ